MSDFVNSAAAYHFADAGRNLVTNGTFVVQQRGAGPFSAGNQYTADRWWLATNNGTNSVSVNTMVDSDRAAIGNEQAQYCITNTFTGSATAGSYNFLLQYVENVRRLSGKTVTVSFWAASSAGQKVGVTWNQNFGSGGSPSAQVSGVGQAVTVTASVWARYSVTLSIASASGKTLGTNGNDCTSIEFWFSDAGTYATRSGGVGVQSGSVSVWGVQCEIGSVATPLDAGGTPQQILAECQRFYQTGAFWFPGYGKAAAWTGYTVELPVTMRADPTLTADWQTLSNLGSGTISVFSHGVIVYATAVATDATFIAGTFTASADL